MVRNGQGRVRFTKKITRTKRGGTELLQNTRKGGGNIKHAKVGSWNSKSGKWGELPLEKPVEAKPHTGRKMVPKKKRFLGTASSTDWGGW